MKQFHFDYADGADFLGFLESVREQAGETNGSSLLFSIHSDTTDRSLMKQVAHEINEVLPNAAYCGGSSGGNIRDGQYVRGKTRNVSVVCNLFEKASTRVEVHQFPLDYSHCRSTAEALLDLLNERPWVKAVGMLTTVIDVSMADFRAQLSNARDDVVFFGGGVFQSEDTDLYNGRPFVCSSAGDASGHAIVFTLYGGPDFHITTQAVFGWKPFGLSLEITKAEGPELFELDGQPAYERYRHYLSVENDESFAQNSLIFPLMIEYKGQSVIRAPVKVGEGNSLVLTSDLASYHKRCRIAYGDPTTILESIKQSVRAIQSFAPQGIHVYSCAARLMYWGANYASCETLPFQAVAPTAGFYTGGEFSREGRRLLHHNVTLVVAAMREGDAPHESVFADVKVNERQFTRQMAIVHSLTTFISVVSSELRGAYDKMTLLATTDGLTGVFNRREIEQRVADEIELYNYERLMHKPDVEYVPAHEPPVLIMLDIDNFKQVNDAYGHKAGDDVLKGLGSLLKDMVDEPTSGISGRWGGEEFMVMMPRTSLAYATDLAQSICDAFSQIDFPASGKHTVSIGVAQALPAETTDLLCQRVDKALYAAKKKGKNCVVAA